MKFEKFDMKKLIGKR